MVTNDQGAEGVRREQGAGEAPRSVRPQRPRPELPAGPAAGRGGRHVRDRQAGGGWDTHKDNFKQLKDNLLPKFDGGVAALVADLHDRGLSDDVLVMAMGEFGRTPKINKDAGRDHWPGAMSVLYAGGGLKMGQADRHDQRDGRVPDEQAVHARLRAEHDVPRPGHRPQARVHRPGPTAAADPERRRADST